jgi:queuine/archaeosine tRNA-ribosyltransferase
LEVAQVLLGGLVFGAIEGGTVVEGHGAQFVKMDGFDGDGFAAGGLVGLEEEAEAVWLFEGTADSLGDDG